MHFGKCLAVALQEQDLTYEKMGDLIGAEKQRVYHMTRQENVNSGTLTKVAKVLGYSLDEFAALEDE